MNTKFHIIEWLFLATFTLMLFFLTSLAASILEALFIFSVAAWIVSVIILINWIIR